jgi:hypothetical protein
MANVPRRRRPNWERGGRQAGGKVRTTTHFGDYRVL